MTLELVIVVCLTNLGAKDEGDSHRENHVVEVRRALNREVVERPYLARQLSVFDDRQLVMGYPRRCSKGSGVRRTRQ